VRRLECGPQLLVARIPELEPRRQASLPEGLGHPQVPDPRDEPLSLERLAERQALRRAAEVREHRIEIGRLREHVRAEPSRHVRVELEHRPVQLNCLVLGAPQDEPWAAEPARAPAADPPPTLHPQVAAEDDAPFEAQEEVLPGRLHALQPPAVEPLGDARQLRPRVRRLDLESLADEDLEPPRRPLQGIALRHAGQRSLPGMTSRVRAAAAGAAAATVWGLLEPLDERLFRSDYRDVALLGKLVTRGRGWRAAGFVLHAANGALFGIGFDTVRPRTRLSPRRLAVLLALGENVVLYPLAVLAYRKHPRRGEPHLPPLATPRVFAQETFRHALFGLVLGSLHSGDDTGGGGASR
jgi:hypothetical protein